MARTKQESMKLAELARVTSVPPRTIRLYIARGLLEGPSRMGRGAVYKPKHIQRLAEIRRLQERGLTLKEIGRLLAGGKDVPTLPGPESWWSYRLAEDVVVNVRADVSPWQGRLIQKTLARIASELAVPEKGGQKQ